MDSPSYSPVPPPSPPASTTNYYSWGTAVYATLTAAAILLSVSGCLIMLNRTYWRPRRLRRAAALAAANRMRAGGARGPLAQGRRAGCACPDRRGPRPESLFSCRAGYDLENPPPPEAPPKWKMPVVVVQPGGAVELASKEELPGSEGAESPKSPRGAVPARRASGGSGGTVTPSAGSLTRSGSQTAGPSPYAAPVQYSAPSQGYYMSSVGAGPGHALAMMQLSRMTNRASPAWPQLQLMAPSGLTPRYDVRTRVHRPYNRGGEDGKGGGLWWAVHRLKGDGMWRVLWECFSVMHGIQMAHTRALDGNSWGTPSHVAWALY